MAENGDNQFTHEVAPHEATWAAFKVVMYWGTIGCALVGALVVFLIAS